MPGRLRMRGFTLPLLAWVLVLFAVTLATALIGSLLIQRSTRATANDVASLLEEFGPIARRSRELSDAAAAYDRAMLAYLRIDSSANRAAVLAAAKRLLGATGAGGASEGDQVRGAATGELLQVHIVKHVARGNDLVAMQDRRQASVTQMQSLFEDLATRIDRSGGARGNAAFESRVRQARADLADSLESVRIDASLQLVQGAAWNGSRSLPSEQNFIRDVREHATALGASGGIEAGIMISEEFDRAVRLRRAVLDYDRDIDANRREFVTGSELLGAYIRDNVEGPAWNRLAATAKDARSSAEQARNAVKIATYQFVGIALALLALTSWLLLHPLRRLSSASRQLAAGNLTVRAAGSPVREVDELATSFNHLAQELDIAERAVRSYQAQLEQRVAERTVQLRHLAEHDPLTNLPNRRRLFQRLDELVSRAVETREKIAVLFLDLDNFKLVNDNLGHEVGDRVLTQIGERLRRISGETGFIARIGGDEFTLLFPFSGSLAEMEARTETLIAQFQQPFSIDRRELSIGVSCGAAVYPDHGQDATSLLRAADAALFRAKELGRNRVCVFEPALLADASNRFRVEQMLRRAIDAGDILLHYQPQVSLGASETLSVEALLRWRQDDNQLMTASEFIGVAEQSGMMLDLNDWVLDTALAAVCEWRRKGWANARVAVNVSGQQFLAGGMVARVRELLVKYELPGEALELELTEGMLQSGAPAIDTLRELRALGVATVLDDFGTGYSSLTSIEQLPLSRVKLDRAVVAEVDWNPRAASVAHSIVTLCRNLGLQVTVEGVERPSQLDFVASCGDVTVQGFLVAPPAPADQVTDFVARTPQRVSSLLEAAELSRAEHPELSEDGLVRLFRRKRATRSGDGG